MAFKHYTKCKKCKRHYGYDTKIDNGICPICSSEKRLKALRETLKQNELEKNKL